MGGGNHGDEGVLLSDYPSPDSKSSADVAIPRKYRELIMIALEIGTQEGGGQGLGRTPGVHHTRIAVAEASVTPQEIAEVVAITHTCAAIRRLPTMALPLS